MFGFCSPSYTRQSLTDSGAGSKLLSPPPQLELTGTFYPCSGHLRSGLPTHLLASEHLNDWNTLQRRRVDLDNGTLWLKDWDYSRGPVHLSSWTTLAWLCITENKNTLLTRQPCFKTKVTDLTLQLVIIEFTAYNTVFKTVSLCSLGCPGIYRDLPAYL